jgi:hypothetical protein
MMDVGNDELKIYFFQFFMDFSLNLFLDFFNGFLWEN